MPKVTFNNSNSAFFQSVKKAVEEYFQKQQLKKTGNWKLYLKSAVLIPAALIIYCFLLFFSYPAAVGVFLSMLLGFVLATIGFNVMHDACHGSYSERKWVNDVMGFSMNVLGSNAFIWKVKHNIIHHTYTNIDGVDDDIAKNPLLRHCSTQKWLPMHRYQYLYMFFLYTLSTLSWILVADFVKYFSRKVYTTPLKTMNRNDHFIFWISKAGYILSFIVIPILLAGWLPWLIGFLCMHLTLGLALALVFQLAHVVEHTSFQVAGLEPKVIESEWAVHQVRTTANFAGKSRVVSWLLGGLNFQIEHHLFPRISHVHYPALSKIIREICMRHGLPYNYYPTMLQAVGSHVRMMKQLGSEV